MWASERSPCVSPYSLSAAARCFTQMWAVPGLSHTRCCKFPLWPDFLWQELLEHARARTDAQTHTRTHIHPSPLSPTVVCFTCFHILCTCTSRSSTAACGSTSGCCQACRCGSTLAQISTTGVTLVPRLHAAEPVKLSYSHPHCADLLSVSQCLVHPLIPNLPVEILFPNKSSGIQICKLVWSHICHTNTPSVWANGSPLKIL